MGEPETTPQPAERPTGVNVERLLRSEPRIPDNVVAREFVHHTVVLNLDTGLYHQLNETGGRMLELLREKDTVREAAQALAAEFPEAADKITRDLCIFCLELSRRGLIQLGRG